MPKLRVLSGKDAIKILKQFGFMEHSRKGSHVKLRRRKAGKVQTLIVPDHKELERGMRREILDQASQYIPIDDLKPFFYAD